MKDDLGSGNYIFVVSQNDLFAEEVDKKFINDILVKCFQYNNTYLFQTKNPSRLLHYTQYMDKDQCKLCFTLETNRHYPEIMMASLPPVCRAYYLKTFKKKMEDFERSITIEPIMDFDLDEFVNMIRDCEPKFVNIGANSYSKVVLPEPDSGKIHKLISELKKFTTVIEKDNLKRLLK